MVQMDTPHKNIGGTSPVALKFNQQRVHLLGDPIPWHVHRGYVYCPTCSEKYSLLGDYPADRCIAELTKHHEENKDHPDVLRLDPAFTPIVPCYCQDWFAVLGEAQPRTSENKDRQTSHRPIKWVQLESDATRLSIDEATSFAGELRKADTKHRYYVKRETAYEILNIGHPPDIFVIRREEIS
jgi:hypothetical protein